MERYWQMKLKLQKQILLVNLAILAGLILQFFRGLPPFVLLTSGILLLLLANVIFFVRWQRLKNWP